MAQGGGGGDAGTQGGAGRLPVNWYKNSPAYKAKQMQKAMQKAQSLLTGLGGQRTRRKGMLVGDAMIPALLGG